VDDGTTEDDFFDPGDPGRRFGPSSTCAPRKVFGYVGDTDDLFAVDAIGRATDGPGLQGTTGLGTWVESRFRLDRYRGQRIRLRFLFASLKVGSFETYQSVFGLNPSPSDDGWWIDDVLVTDALMVPALLSADTKDNSSLVTDLGLDPDNDGSCTALDCDNTRGHVFPGAPQVCDGLNNDCDDPGWPALPPDETSDDGDAFSECAGDCDDTDSTVWGTPSEVTRLLVSAAQGEAVLSWNPPDVPGGLFPLYDVILATGPMNFDTISALCIESDDGSDTTATDTTPDPPSGGAHYYLVRASQPCPSSVDGPIGTTSGGQVRGARLCP
jgi:hypothetical protein